MPKLSILSIIGGTQHGTPIKEIILKYTKFNLHTFGYCYMALCSQAVQFVEYHHHKAMQNETYGYSMLQRIAFCLTFPSRALVTRVFGHEAQRVAIKKLHLLHMCN